MSEKGDLISRETLGVGRCNPDVMLDPAYAAGWNALLNIINNAPAVDAAPVVHGRWIEKSYLLGTTRYCSECVKTTVCHMEYLTTAPTAGRRWTEGIDHA